ncbi:radical SAM family heme chaperone HemW [Edaphobacter albus]|uniref:radical SAM family heme chaperone HemW n=1 Tax=Edaphobacter sp. 4G125 TaxID=2763071 RepID=UPI002102978D|nr:radical SAM family heme chaperone HemW [Edaphobacter sp. 4G125]
MVSPLGIYVSVPFCKAKCSFCNFASDAFGPERMDGYVDRLCREIAETRLSVARMDARLERTVDSVYFGGGTPSLLSAEQFRTIFTTLRDEFEIRSEAEITLECAPGQLSEETLEELLGQGVNRVSLGVQSFVDREARAVGRLHTRVMCEEEIARLRRAGIRDVGIDLIAGLPHQTEGSWRESLERAIASGVEHVSVYMLEVDEDSRLGREALKGGERYGAENLPSEDESAALYEVACEALDVGGVRQYEISNFAREGHTSRHNVKYWKRLPYIGFGLDAHSMLRAGEGAVRFQNVDDLDVYMGDPSELKVLPQKNAKPDPEFVSREAAFEESLFLGLRLVEGVCFDDLQREFGVELVAAVMPGVEESREAGLLDVSEGRIFLTARGRMASNEVFCRLLISATA